jgi:hypothetical protein
MATMDRGEIQKHEHVEMDGVAHECAKSLIIGDFQLATAKGKAELLVLPTLTLRTAADQRHKVAQDFSGWPAPV